MNLIAGQSLLKAASDRENLHLRAHAAIDSSTNQLKLSRVGVACMAVGDACVELATVIAGITTTTTALMVVITVTCFVQVT